MHSIFTITTPASETSLLTIEELRAAAGVVGGSQDAILQVMGRSLSEAIARDCGVAWDGVNVPTLLSETCRQVFFPDRGTTKLRLARRPVSEVSSLAVDETIIDEAGYRLDAASGAIWPRRGTWCADEITIVFKAGFAAAPPSMKLAASKLMTSLWAERQRDPSLKREDIPGVIEREWWVSEKDNPLMSQEIRDLIAPYVERWL